MPWRLEDNLKEAKQRIAELERENAALKKSHQRIKRETLEAAAISFYSSSQFRLEDVERIQRHIRSLSPDGPGAGEGTT